MTKQRPDVENWFHYLGSYILSLNTQEVIRVLKLTHNAVIEGPPGTGKTYTIGEIAGLWETVTDRKLAGQGTGAYAITFHPSTTYEDFVEGLRYDEVHQRFARKDGFLLGIVAIAKKHPDNDFLVLLDEINRANVPKVLGDLLLCMESSKRDAWDGLSWGGGMSVTLPFSGRLFSLPGNIYLLGTMNTSDRSIAPLDAALRRRFAFVRSQPLSEVELTDRITALEGARSAARIGNSIRQWASLNQLLERAGGPDAVLGHSYLFGLSTPEPAGPPIPFAAGAFWMESGSASGGSKNQFDIPDANGTRKGIAPSFFEHLLTPPLPANLKTVEQTYFDVVYEGMTWTRCSIQYNSGGSNFRLKLMGRSGDFQMSTRINGKLDGKILVWTPLPDQNFQMTVLEDTPEALAALRAASGWTERTMSGASGREYGGLSHQPKLVSEPNPDAERFAWQYSLLPQVIETATALGFVQLFSPLSRLEWLRNNNLTVESSRLASLDKFLSELGLKLVERGQGMGKTVVVERFTPSAGGDDLALDYAGAADTVSPDEEMSSPVATIQDKRETTSDEGHSEELQDV